MTGPEHYAEAERCTDTAAREYDKGDPIAARFELERAQVHATLALAAATALPPFRGLSASDSDDWAQALERVVTS